MLAGTLIDPPPPPTLPYPPLSHFALLLLLHFYEEEVAFNAAHVGAPRENLHFSTLHHRFD